jgi:ketosteroid isomerase-like protein
MTDNLSYEEWKKQKEIEEKNIAIVKTVADAVGEGDAETITSYLHDNLQYMMMGTTPFSGHRNGKAEFLELFGDVASYLDGMIPLDIKNIVASGDWVVVEATGDGKTKTGKSYNNSYCQIWRFKNGLAVELREYLDTQLVMDVFFKE